MKITKIESQKRNKSRYNLYIDDEFAFGISEEVLIYFSLHKGMALDQSLFENIQLKEFNEKIYTRAINYLSYGLRTVKEMRDYLSKIELDHPIEDQKPQRLDDHLIEQTIQKLIEQNYLNDLMYAESYVRTQANLNQKGVLSIHRELRQKGVDEHTIDDAMVEYPHDQQVENALETAEKYIKKNLKLPPRTMRMRLQQYLLTRGFSRDIINLTLDEISFDRSESDLNAMIQTEAEKSFNRRSRRYEGYELKQRMMQDLMRRGFDFELIQQWFDNHYQTLVEEGE